MRPRNFQRDVMTLVFAFKHLRNPTVKRFLQQRSAFYSSNARPLSSLKQTSEKIVRSPFPDVHVDRNTTITDAIFEVASLWPHLPAMECGTSGKVLKYKDIIEQSKSFAAALKAAGYGKGDTLSIVLANCVEYPIPLLSAWLLGITVSPTNPAYTADEIKRQLVSSESTCVVTSPAFIDSIKSLKSTNPKIKDIIVIGEPQEGCHTFSEMIKTNWKGTEFLTGNDIDTNEEIALLPYSSGTTGPPKGVMLSYYNMYANLMQFNVEGVSVTRRYDLCGYQERLLGLLPFFHAYGSAAVMFNGLYQGSHIYCLPRFEPSTFLKAFESHKPTFIHLVTPLISYINNSADFNASHFSETHSIVAAAAPLGPGILKDLLKKTEKDIFVQEGYGMTELSPVSNIMIEKYRNSKLGSCGVLVPSTLSKIIDTDTGESVGQNETGELCIMGPQVMKGYFNNQEATDSTIDSEGWLHTGDIACYDEDGCFYIVDRLKELIKVKGFQVAPSELEDIIRKHEKVSDVAVIGVANQESGEAPRAYIVKKDSSLSDEDLNEFLKPQIATFKRLTGGIEFIKEIPKAPSGKILRRELKDDYLKKFG